MPVAWSNSWSPLLSSESSEHEDKSADAAQEGNQTDASTDGAKDEGQSLKMTVPKPEENEELGLLPDNWEMAYTEKGEVYFIE